MTLPTDSINDEYRAARTEAALRDASHWGRLWIRGADHLDFLHRMTTNSFNGLETGQGCEAVFVEQRARIIDLGVFYRGTESTLLLLNPQSREEIPIWLDRFIFAEAIEFEDVTDKTAMLECCGPHMAKLLQQALSLDLDQHQDGHLIVTSNCHVLEAKGEFLRDLGGRCTHRLAAQDASFKIASKRFDLVNCDAPHDGFNVPI